MFVNERFFLADALIHGAIESETAPPPTTPANGQNRLIATGASGAWAGQSGKLSCRQGGQWIFVLPSDEMAILNKAAGQIIRRVGGRWKAPTAPVQPSGGTVVDSQARDSINLLLQKLRDAGILRQNESRCFKGFPDLASCWHEGLIFLVSTQKMRHSCNRLAHCMLARVIHRR